jgi:hypothetical protein
MKKIINESKQVIRNAINNNKLVIFVGAGVSKNSGYPLWHEIIDRFSSGLFEETRGTDYLKIPQFYYNVRGSKEYYDLLHNLMDIKREPNEIHEALLELSPKHIITTNYDNLIESAANAKGDFFSVVSKDEDLPYSVNDKKIIKMHGDLNNKNVVLKEDDYLSYENNFKLISNFIRSLISTHVILFVGYSLNDQNLNLLFQSIKDELKHNFQPAYFLSLDKFNYLDYDYYKHKGVHIINFDQIQDKCPQINSTKLSQKGNELLTFVKFFSEDEDSNLNCINNPKNIIKSLLNRIQHLDVLNKILQRDLDKSLSGIKDLRVHNKKIIFEKENHQILIGFKNEIENVIKSKEFISLLKILNKSGISEICYTNEQQFMSINTLININDYVTNEEDEMLVELNYFNYMSILSWLENSQDTQNNEYIGLKKAYFFYKLNKFEAAYKTLKNTSYHALSKQNYYIFFLSEFNREHLGKLIKNGHLIPVDNKVREQIINEIKAIDLEEYFLKLPKSLRESLSPLKEMLINLGFFYKAIPRIQEMMEKVLEEKDTTYIGGPQLGRIEELRSEIIELFEFSQQNYLAIDIYKEVKNIYKRYIEIFFQSYVNKMDKREPIVSEFWGEEGFIPGVEKFDKFTIHLMLNNIQFKNLKKIINKYEVKSIEVTEEVLEYLKVSFNNIIRSSNDFSYYDDRNSILFNHLLLLGKISLSKEDFNIISNLIREFIKSDRKDHIDFYKGLLLFFNNQYNNNKENISENIKEILEILIGKIDNCDEIIKSELSGLIRILTLILREREQNFQLLSFMNVKKVVENYSLTLQLIPLLNGETKKLIIEEINNILKANFNFNLYTEALQQGYNIKSLNFESKLYSFIDNSIKNRKDTIRSYPDHLERVLIKVFNLNINGYIDNKEKLLEYKGYIALYDFLIDPLNFDFHNFQLAWVESISKDLAKHFVEESFVKQKLREIFKIEVRNNRATLRMLDFYFDYLD